MYIFQLTASVLFHWDISTSSPFFEPPSFPQRFASLARPRCREGWTSLYWSSRRREPATWQSREGSPKHKKNFGMTNLIRRLSDPSAEGYPSPNPVLLSRKNLVKVSVLSSSLTGLSCKSMLTNADVTRAVTKRLIPTNTSDQKISLAL